MGTVNDRQAARKKDLDRKILSTTHLLYPYVKNRIKIAEQYGILPKNMYKSNEIIDEVVLNMYENHIDSEIEINQLRLMMFTETNEKLNDLIENEKFHINSVSTKLILEEELKQLEENFTVEADNDLIMTEDLDDISYHQNDNGLHLLESDDTQQDVAAFLEIKDASKFFNENANKKTLSHVYNKLPMKTSNVVDLYLLGKLNYQEVAHVLNADVVEVKRIVQFVKEKFKKHLN